MRDVFISRSALKGLIHFKSLSVTQNDSVTNELDRTYKKAAIAHDQIELQP
jgi:hypothetical protein